MLKLSGLLARVVPVSSRNPSEEIPMRLKTHKDSAGNLRPHLWTTHPLSSGLPLFLIPELRAVSGNLRQPEVKCFAA